MSALLAFVVYRLYEATLIYALWFRLLITRPLCGMWVGIFVPTLGCLIHVLFWICLILVPAYHYGHWIIVGSGLAFVCAVIATNIRYLRGLGQH